MSKKEKKNIALRELFFFCYAINVEEAVRKDIAVMLCFFFFIHLHILGEGGGVIS